MNFTSPVTKVVKQNTAVKNIQTYFAGIKIDGEADHCNFCGKPVSVFPVYEQSSNVENFGFDLIIQKLCCEEMRSRAGKLRKEHQREYIEFRIKEIDLISTPLIYRAFRINNFKQGWIVKKVKDFSAGLTGKGLYIYSAKNGTGKTTLSCVSAKTYCAYWGIEKYRFFNYAEFVNKFESLDFNERGELMEIYKTARVLIIDDLGKGRLSPMSLSNIYDIVNYRNMNALITIVSSNLSLDQISESFDSSVASRLFEMCELVEMKGEDLRIKPAKQEVTR